MTHANHDESFLDPELDGSNAAIARDMREAAEASRRRASEPASAEAVSAEQQAAKEQPLDAHERSAEARDQR